MYQRCPMGTCCAATLSAHTCVCLTLLCGVRACVRASDGRNQGVRDSTVPLVWHWNAPMWCEKPIDYLLRYLFMLKIQHFCRAMLGTTIGKALKTRYAFFALQVGGQHNQRERQDDDHGRLHALGADHMEGTLREIMAHAPAVRNTPFGEEPFYQHLGTRLVVLC
jgi:hypothetical protein